MSPNVDGDERPLHRNLKDLERPMEESPERAEVENPHGEIARMPEEDVDLDRPHVGDARGPVLDERENPRLREEGRAMDPDIGYEEPPIRPKTDLIQ